MRIPLTVLGGFLGAGKTTLVNRILREAGGRRIAVLVNDFGELNVDVALIESVSGQTIALTNGCVCCSIGEDLNAALIRVLDTQPAFDEVVVEASGVSDPWRVAQIASADPGLALGGVIVLVDASAAAMQASDPLLADTLQRQLEAADLIVVNKTELASTEELARVRVWLDGTIPATPRFETREAAVPSALLRDPLPRAQRSSRARGEHEHAHHDALFETWLAQPLGVLSAGALRALLAQMPRGVLRLKGFVRTDELGWSELQFAGRHGSLRRALTVPSDGAALVAIGLRGQLPLAALDARLAAATIA
jgi:G3E family GTPase